jgi:hypothetical protein
MTELEELDWRITSWPINHRESNAEYELERQRCRMHHNWRAFDQFSLFTRRFRRNCAEKLTAEYFWVFTTPSFSNTTGSIRINLVEVLEHISWLYLIYISLNDMHTRYMDSGRWTVGCALPVPNSKKLKQASTLTSAKLTPQMSQFTRNRVHVGCCWAIVGRRETAVDDFNADAWTKARLHSKLTRFAHASSYEEIRTRLVQWSFFLLQHYSRLFSAEVGLSSFATYSVLYSSAFASGGFSLLLFGRLDEDSS